jgi:hypothetical protein
MNKSESITELAKALNKFQAECSGAKKSKKNPFFKSTYANLEEVINCAKEALDANGLSVSQFPVSHENKAGVETILMHSSGEWISSTLLLACSKQDPQGMGSAITYARRYAYQSVLGIPSEDDDGNKATYGNRTPQQKPAPQSNKPQTINASQLKRLQTMNKRSTEEAKALIESYGFSSSRFITTDKYDAIVADLSK